MICGQVCKPITFPIHILSNPRLLSLSHLCLISLLSPYPTQPNTLYLIYIYIYVISDSPDNLNNPVCLYSGDSPTHASGEWFFHGKRILESTLIDLMFFHEMDEAHEITLGITLITLITLLNLMITQITLAPPILLLYISWCEFPESS